MKRIGALAALAAAALRAVAHMHGPREVPGTGPAPVPVTANQSRPRLAGTTGMHGRAVRHMARPRPPGQSAGAVVQAQHIFHELHADGRNALCAVCDSQYGPA